MKILIIILGCLIYGIFSSKKKPEENEFIYKLTEITKEPQEITLKSNSINPENIIEYTGENIKKYEFRPQTLDQFIGQEEAKARAITLIKKTQQGMKAHFLVNGIQGHGKTTFCEIIGNMLNAKIIKRIGKQIDEPGIESLVNEINTSKEKNIMLFIDEIDTMDWQILKIFNPIIESFEIVGKKIKPFIFAGATINKHKLIKYNPDTMDRISTHINFNRYTAEDISKIILQYKYQLYASNIINKNIIDIISANCKFNPRIAITILEDFIIENDIKQVLKNSKIVKAGLTTTDINILKILLDSKKAIGANALAIKAKLSEKEYLTEFEPFLLEYDYINRVPSRIITNKGKELLNEIL